jgi:HK97 family phage major capsid protein
MQTVKETVEQLGKSFAEFKITNDEKNFKTSSAGGHDPLIEEKLTRISEDIDRTSARLERLKTARHRPALAEESLDHKVENEHKNAFIHYVRKGEEQYLLNFERKSLSTAVDPDGGYLIPQEIHNRLGQNILDSSAMRKIASTITISTDAVEFLIDQKGAEAGWVSETGDREETESPTLSKIRIPVHEMYAKPKATQKLLDDARIDVEAWLSAKVSEKMAYMENRAFFCGNGEGQPTGFLAYPKTYGTFKSDHLLAFKTGKKGGFSAQNSCDVFIDALHSLRPELLNGAVWVMSRSTLAAVRKLKDSNGHYLWQAGLEGDFRQRILGYPIELSDEMPPLDLEEASSAIAFGNFKRGYQIVDRAGTRVLRDPYSSKPYVEFYTTRRVGGNLIDSRAISLIEFNT